MAPFDGRALFWYLSWHFCGVFLRKPLDMHLPPHVSQIVHHDCGYHNTPKNMVTQTQMLSIRPPQFCLGKYTYSGKHFLMKFILFFIKALCEKSLNGQGYPNGIYIEIIKDSSV